MKKILLFLSLSLSVSLYPIVRLLTFHYKREDLVRCQCEAYKKFFKDPFELIVFSDAPDDEYHSKIEKVCNEYGVRCIRFNQEWHPNAPLSLKIDEWAYLKNITGFRELGILRHNHPSVRHCNVVQYALDNFGYNHDDIVGLIDGDLFPIRDFSIRHYMKEVDIIGTKSFDETRACEFFWLGCCFFNVK